MDTLQESDNTNTTIPITKLPDPFDSNMNQTLFNLVQKAVSRELLIANNYTNRLTIYLRVLKRIVDFMGITWSAIQDLKNLIPIHKDCFLAVEIIWQCQQKRLSSPVYCSASNSNNNNNNNNNTAAILTGQEENNILEKFMSRDYARPADLAKLINILVKRETNADKRNPEKSLPNPFSSPEWGNIYQLLAVDGFLGPDLKNYWEALRYSFDNCNPEKEKDCHFVHVNAVRRMYQLNNNIRPVHIREAIDRAFQRKSFLTYSEETENVIENLKNVYLSIVGNHLDAIRKWKIYELEQYESKRKNSSIKMEATNFMHKNETNNNNNGATEVVMKRKRGRQPKTNKTVATNSTIATPTTANIDTAAEEGPISKKPKEDDYPLSVTVVKPTLAQIIPRKEMKPREDVDEEGDDDDDDEEEETTGDENE